jgi:hypothetical protein
MLGGTLWNLALNGGDVEMDESLREIKMHPKDHFGFHLTAHVGDWQMTKRDLFAARPMVRYRFGMHGDIAAPGFQMQVIGGDLALLGYGSTGLASQPTPNGTEFFTDKTPFIVIDPEAKLLRTLEKSTHRRQ